MDCEQPCKELDGWLLAVHNPTAAALVYSVEAGAKVSPTSGIVGPLAMAVVKVGVSESGDIMESPLLAVTVQEAAKAGGRWGVWGGAVMRVFHADEAGFNIGGLDVSVHKLPPNGVTPIPFP